MDYGVHRQRCQECGQFVGSDAETPLLCAACQADYDAIWVETRERVEARRRSRDGE